MIIRTTIIFKLHLILDIIYPNYFKHRIGMTLNPSFRVDATTVAVDINTIKKYISKEELEKLDLKWGFSKTRIHYIGFKVTVVLDKNTLCPISILIHAGALMTRNI